MSMAVLDSDRHPVSALDIDAGPFTVTGDVSWTPDALAETGAEQVAITVYLEQIGGAYEGEAGQQVLPVAGRDRITFSVEISPPRPSDDSFLTASSIYKVIVVAVFQSSAGRNTDLVAFVEGPILRIG